MMIEERILDDSIEVKTKIELNHKKLNICATTLKDFT
jgi:hypothetical protein